MTTTFDQTILDSEATKVDFDRALAELKASTAALRLELDAYAEHLDQIAHRGRDNAQVEE